MKIEAPFVGDLASFIVFDYLGIPVHINNLDACSVIGSLLLTT